MGIHPFDYYSLVPLYKYSLISTIFSRLYHNNLQNWSSELFYPSYTSIMWLAGCNYQPNWWMPRVEIFCFKKYPLIYVLKNLLISRNPENTCFELLNLFLLGNKTLSAQWLHHISGFSSKLELYQYLKTSNI